MRLRNTVEWIKVAGPKTGNVQSLAFRYLISSAAIVALGSLVIGAWVSNKIVEGVTQNAAISTALYVDSFISPLVRELESAQTLSVGPIRALDEIFKDGVLKDRLVSVKIWRPDGTIVYSPDYDLIGSQFEVTPNLAAALEGKVAADFDELEDIENAREREMGIPLLEIYSPVRAPWSGKVVAVAEFYENGTALKSTMEAARWQSWAIVASVMAAVAGILAIFVLWASRKIESQQQELENRLADVTRNSEQNRKLHERLQIASAKVTELNERFLKRTSADLHDGPAQLVGFASLRLGEALKIQDKKHQEAEIQVIEKALDEAMNEIRNISKGLAVPEIADLTVSETVKRVCRSFEDRDNKKIDLLIENADLKASTAVKLSIYRFIQEALNNIRKHAPASLGRVSCVGNPDSSALKITVEDDGPGFQLSTLEDSAEKLGLGGLQERLHSVGAELSIDSQIGRGTRLEMLVPGQRGASA